MVKSDLRCKVAECDRQNYARGYCKAHYARMWRYGTTEIKRPIATWARKFERCIQCGTDTIPHVGKGLCRDCAQQKYSAGYRTKTRKRELKRYNLTPEQFDEMWEIQGGRCLICLRMPKAKMIMKGQKLSHALHIDHDHQTNRVRALLCESCNRGLGFFFDDPDLLLAAAAYLQKWRAAVAEEGKRSILQ